MLSAIVWRRGVQWAAVRVDLRVCTDGGWQVADATSGDGGPPLMRG